MNSNELSQLLENIDWTIFAADATRADLEKLCAEARQKSYRAVCVNGSRVELARTLLDEAESSVKVVALIGFPLGASDCDSKRYETEIAVDHGAHEIEVVINVGRLKDGDHQYVLRELRDIAEAADERPVVAVIESHLLSRDEKILACQVVLDSGAHFIVNATDFHSPNCAFGEIKLLRETIGETFGVKAAGNIRDAQTALRLMEAGATRIGISSGWI
jgi:deoxyribose-phosphate aldolase